MDIKTSTEIRIQLKYLLTLPEFITLYMISIFRKQLILLLFVCPFYHSLIILVVFALLSIL